MRKERKLPFILPESIFKISAFINHLNITMKTLTFLLLLLSPAVLSAQTIEELYEKQDYAAIIAHADHSDTLTDMNLYVIGYAFFQLGDDERAIEFYDKALALTPDGVVFHFYKGLSLRFLGRYREALAEIELAVAGNPGSQEYVNEQGKVYYNLGEYDKALEVFEAAKKLENTFPEPYFWVGMIYDKQGLPEKALPAFYEAVEMIPVENSYHHDSWSMIGEIEYELKNYEKSVTGFKRAFEAGPNDWEQHARMMRSLNAWGKYDEADKAFATMKKAFEAGKLPAEDMEMGSTMFAQFEWNGQKAIVYRTFKDPEETLDISYRVYVLNPEGSEIVRRFQVEKTLQFKKKGTRHLFCERVKESGDHITYPYGWKTDEIPVKDIEEAVRLVLDGKMTMGASSSFGN